MEKYFNLLCITIGLIGGKISGLLGGWDILLKTILLMVILDYITGIMKGIYIKQLSSEAGYKGILKKIVIFTVIAAANLLQQLIGGSIPIRETAVMFFIANEGISLLENAAVMIPIPEGLQEILLQLREKSENKEKKEFKEKKEEKRNANRNS